MAETKIEWATHTENYQSGCTKLSKACTHCYAIPMSIRLANMGGPERYQGVTNGDLSNPQWNGTIRWDAEAMRRIFQGLSAARKPRRVFLNSMTDTFHADADPTALETLASYLRSWVLDHHVVMLLTKRPENLLAWQRRYFPAGLPANVAVGITAEEQKEYDNRLSHLAQVEASVRFLSVEPLFSPLNLRLAADVPGRVIRDYVPISSRIQWVIAGGESGNKARPSHPDWFRSLRDQCAQYEIPFLFKQWGEWCPPLEGQRYNTRHGWDGSPAAFLIDSFGLKHENPRDAGEGALPMIRLGKHAAGRSLDGRTHDALPAGWAA